SRPSPWQKKLRKGCEGLPTWIASIGRCQFLAVWKPAVTGLDPCEDSAWVLSEAKRHECCQTGKSVSQVHSGRQSHPRSRILSLERSCGTWSSPKRYARHSLDGSGRHCRDGRSN